MKPFYLTLVEVEIVAKILGYTIASNQSFEDAVSEIRRRNEDAFQDAAAQAKAMKIGRNDFKAFQAFIAA